MKTVIYCETTDRGLHSFYMHCEGREYYLFSQNYRKGVQEFYKSGVYLNESIDFAKAHKDTAIVRTMTKIPVYIKYVEKEHGLEILEQTKKRSRSEHISRKCA